MTANASPGKQAAGCDAKLDLTGSLCCGVEVIMTGSCSNRQSAQMHRKYLLCFSQCHGCCDSVVFLARDMSRAVAELLRMLIFDKVQVGQLRERERHSLIFANTKWSRACTHITLVLSEFRQNTIRYVWTWQGR